MIIITHQNGVMKRYKGDITLVVHENMLFVDSVELSKDYDKTIESMTHDTMLLQTVLTIVGVDSDVR